MVWKLNFRIKCVHSLFVLPFFKTREFMLMSELVVAVSVCLSVSINVSMYLSDLHKSLRIGLAGYISLKSTIVKLQCEILWFFYLNVCHFSSSQVPKYIVHVAPWRLNHYLRGQWNISDLSKQKTKVKNIFKPVVNVCFGHQCKLICIEQFNNAHLLPNF